MNKIWTKKSIRQTILVLIDIAIVFMSGFVSLAVRFGLTTIPKEYMTLFCKFIPIDIAITILAFWVFKLYHSIWSFASIGEGIKVFKAVTIVSLVQAFYKIIVGWFMPRSYYFLTYAAMLVLVLGSRLSVRILNHYKEIFNGRKKKRTMMIGAGAAGVVMINEIAENKSSQNKIVCIIDDNENKKGKFLSDIPIVGDRDTIVKNAAKYNIEEIIIAMPSLAPSEVAKITEICSKTTCKIKILPSITKALDGNLAAKIRDVSYEDLLGRDPIKVNHVGINEFIKNKVVLVTGGGGSIGSELCRQIIKYEPELLIIFDIYENNAYAVQMELEREYGTKYIATLIGSIRDYDRLEEIFREYKPDIVFHAAAHKHVPLMENSSNEAIKNNCLGTLNMVRLADKYEVKKFILISTDKAVRPTNVMGATKRLCEMIIQTYSKKSKTTFAAVRFGNVLGSNGSVIPLFLKQIADGGPVTVTHKDITRFFMTIPEAVSLVLQAGLFAGGGEIFVLDMGKQVKIYDLAENLIKLKGYRPHEDIKIEIVGLRPGEKLYEEILMDEEGLEKTDNDLIFVGQPIDIDDDFEENLNKLIEIAEKNGDDIKRPLAKVCNTYTITENK